MGQGCGALIWWAIGATVLFVGCCIWGTATIWGMGLLCWVFIGAPLTALIIASEPKQ